MEPTMEEYMIKTRDDYGSGIVRPKIDDKAHFKLKGQFLKELRDNTFSGSDNKYANEHIEKVLEILNLSINMKMEPDIENMTISEYLEYKAAKERSYVMMFDPQEVQQIIMRRMLTLFTGIRDDDSEEDQEEDCDDEDTFDMWDITVEDVEWIRKFFNVPEEIDEIVQPLIPEPIHTIPPNGDYVALATKSILDELLEEFGDEILYVPWLTIRLILIPLKI
ncbi:hypothetical protein Tco_1533555 [Tanacetum coccineum]